MGIVYHSVRWLPASVGLLMLAAMVIAYLIAVVNGDVDALLPYISDTGGLIPESCVFAQFLNMASAVGVVTLYLRYQLFSALYPWCYGHPAPPAYTRLVTANGCIGFLSCFGLSVVGNFQNSDKAVSPVHLTGAALMFGFGTIYIILDCIISRKLCPAFFDQYICYARVSLGALSVVCFFIAAICGTVASRLWEAAYSSNDSPHNSRRHWSAADPGYSLHLTATTGEWGMGLAFIFYFFSFLRDFEVFSAGMHVQLHQEALAAPCGGDSECDYQRAPPGGTDGHQGALPEQVETPRDSFDKSERAPLLGAS